MVSKSGPMGYKHNIRLVGRLELSGTAGTCIHHNFVYSATDPHREDSGLEHTKLTAPLKTRYCQTSVSALTRRIGSQADVRAWPLSSCKPWSTTPKRRNAGELSNSFVLRRANHRSRLLSHFQLSKPSNRQWQYAAKQQLSRPHLPLRFAPWHCFGFRDDTLLLALLRHVGSTHYV